MPYILGHHCKSELSNYRQTEISEVFAKKVEFATINNAYVAKMMTNIEYRLKISEQRTSNQACKCFLFIKMSLEMVEVANFFS